MSAAQPLQTQPQIMTAMYNLEQPNGCIALPYSQTALTVQKILAAAN